MAQPKRSVARGRYISLCLLAVWVVLCAPVLQPAAAQSPTKQPSQGIESTRPAKDVRIGRRGGRYYINRNGKKTYCGRTTPKC